MTQLELDDNRAGTTASRVDRIRRRLVLAVACAAMAMVGLDTAIVNVGLPSIQRDLGVGRSTVQWVVVVYGLLLGGFLLVGGRLADHLGRRRMFLTGLTVFTLGSALAGAAGQAGFLIAARALQGFGAALTAPAALALVAVTFAEGPERDRALGIFGAVGGAAGSVGVVAGGLLAGGPGWRWSFFINVPIGLGCIVAAAVFLTRDEVARARTRLDLAGATTVTMGLLLAVYALHHAASQGWFAGSSLLMAAGSVLLLVLFVRIEARSAAPLVPASTLRNRRLVVANLTAFLAFCVLLAFIFVGSLLMQQVLGYTPIRTGLYWLATTVTVVLASMTGARLVAKIGVRPMLVIGLVVVTTGALWLTRVPTHSTYAIDLLPAFLLAGVGFGFCGPALQIGALSGVSSADSGLASGLVETMRELGGAAGVATVSTVLVASNGVHAFHSAFAFIAGLAVLGAIVAAVGFRSTAGGGDGRLSS
ncbi:MFS transporter [Kribbella sp. NPDC051587]|uniref:MFS transporter n=1 Tax=Kribbella sp. NPDC051587 TaxID=3364119 RepID=UPI0037A40779